MIFKMKSLWAFLIVALACASAFSLQVYGQANDNPNENLLVNAAWLDNEMLRLDVFDFESGLNSSLALRLSDIISEASNSPYILIQAVDLGGNQSGVVQIRNPFYAQMQNGSGFSAPQSGLNPFTPTGTGTVVDNATDGNGKEFLTIFTEDGNEFFLIIDRHRETDNVYLLNTVTEEDLMSLADRNGRNISSSAANPPDSSVSSIPITPQDTSEPQTPPPTAQEPQDEPQTPPPQSGSSGNNNIFLILFAMAAVGGAAYYFKIVKGKNKSSADDDEDEDDICEENDRDYESMDEPNEDVEIDDEYYGDGSEERGGDDEV
jgi:hypothetical protein